jgi:hypothetical protein
VREFVGSDPHPGDDVFEFLQTFLESAERCISTAPDLQTSKWLRNQRLGLSAHLEVLRRVSDPAFVAGIQTPYYEDLAKLFEDRGEAEIARRIREELKTRMGKLRVDFDRLIDPITRDEWPPEYVLLKDVYEALEEVVRSAEWRKRAPQRVKKYFTALCRNENKGEDTLDVMKLEEWINTTETICALPLEEPLGHYRNVWHRLLGQPRATGRAVARLIVLGPHLTPLPGLEPGES